MICRGTSGKTPRTTSRSREALDARGFGSYDCATDYFYGFFLSHVYTVGSVLSSRWTTQGSLTRGYYFRRISVTLELFIQHVRDHHILLRHNTGKSRTSSAIKWWSYLLFWHCQPYHWLVCLSRAPQPEEYSYFCLKFPDRRKAWWWIWWKMQCEDEGRKIWGPFRSERLREFLLSLAD